MCVYRKKKKSQQKIKNKKTYRKCAEKEILSTVIKAERKVILKFFYYFDERGIFSRKSRKNMIVRCIKTY